MVEGISVMSANHASQVFPATLFLKNRQPKAAEALVVTVRVTSRQLLSVPESLLVLVVTNVAPAELICLKSINAPFVGTLFVRI